MIRFIREIRLIPIALIASACLLTLKTADLVLHSSYFADDGSLASGSGEVTVTHPTPDGAPAYGKVVSWAQQMFNFPNGGAASSAASPLPRIAPRFADRDNGDITGSVATEPAGAQAKGSPDAKSPPQVKGPPETKSPADGKNAAAPAVQDAKPPPEGTVIMSDTSGLPSGAERAILERLQARRQELDARARELDIRESLIQNAEKRMDAKLAEIKEVEERIKVETQKKDQAETDRLKGLVTMYQTMKPRDAAKIFNGLDSSVLIEVASQIKPQAMAEILAQMAPDIAQRLTVDMASREQQAKSDGPADLPKIQGQPTAQ